MKFGVSPYGSHQWWYYEGSRKQYDTLQRHVKKRIVSQFNFDVLDDITEEMMGLGQPREVQMDDPLFTKMKDIAEVSRGKGQSVEERFQRLVSTGFYMLELMEDGRRKDKWREVKAQRDKISDEVEGTEVPEIREGKGIYKDV